MKKLVFFTDKLTGRKELEEEATAKMFRELEEDYGVKLTVVDIPPMSWIEFGNYADILDSKGPDALEEFPEAMEEVKDADYLFTSYIGVSSRMIEAAPDLKFIGVARVEPKSVNLSAAKARNIPVSSAKTRIDDVTADYTVGLLLCEVKNFARRDLVHMGHWLPEGSFPLNNSRNRRFKHKRAGIVGLTPIGVEVARRLKGFGVELVACDSEGRTCEELGVRMIPLEELMATSDFVILEEFLNEKTSGMITKDLIDSMKKTAFFVNTAYARLVDEKALLSALQEHRIMGAAIDCFMEKPIPDDSPYYQLDNATVTPALAQDSVDKAEISFDILIEDLKRFIDGRELLNRAA